MRGGDRSGSNPSRAESLCWPSSPRRPRGTVAFTLPLQRTISNGAPVIVVEAVPMQKALSAQRNKTDRNDARGIAHMMRVGCPAKCTSQMRIASACAFSCPVAGSSNANCSTSRTSFAVRSRRSESRSAGSVVLISKRAPWSPSTPQNSGMLAVRRAVWTEYKRLHYALVRVVRQDAVLPAVRDNSGRRMI